MAISVPPAVRRRCVFEQPIVGIDDTWARMEMRVSHMTRGELSP